LNGRCHRAANDLNGHYKDTHKNMPCKSDTIAERKSKPKDSLMKGWVVKLDAGVYLDRQAESLESLQLLSHELALRET
jgi:hypothetical protein